MSSTVTSQLLSVITLLAVVTAPLPVLSHILSGATKQSRVPALLAEKFLVLIVLWTALQSLVVLVLGWTGHLRLAEILWLEGALLGWGLWLISREQGLSVRGLGWDLRGRLVVAPERPSTERALASIACGVALLLSLRVLTVPVTDGDSLWFHLPRVAQWYQQGSLVNPVDQWSGDVHNFFPYTWNALFFLALAPVGHDQFVLMPNVLAWLTLGLATYALGRFVGSHRLGAMFAALLVLLMPLSIKDVQTAHVDLPLAAYFVASVFFTMQGWRYKNRFSLLVALICMAMMAGTTVFGLAYVGLVAALWLYLFSANRLAGKQSGEWRADSALMRGLVVVSIGLLAGSWYVHNAALTGNPLGVVRISILGRVLLPGAMTQAYLNKTTVLYNFSLANSAHWKIFGRALANAFGVPGLVLVLLALAAPFQLLGRPRVRPLLLPVLCVCLFSFFLYTTTPWSAKWGSEAEIHGWFLEYALRYSFPFWGLVGAIAGVVIGARPTAMAAWSLVLLATLAATSATSEGLPRLSTVGLVSACVAVSVFYAFLPSSRRQVSEGLRRLIGPKLTVTTGVTIAAASVIVITLVTAASLKARYRDEDVLQGGISRFIDDLPADTRIGFWDTDALYLFYGKRLQRRLSYLPLDAYSTSDDMLRYLCAQPVDVIAVGPGNPFYELPRPRSWIVKDQQHFERLHGKDPRVDVFVYRLNRSEAVGAAHAGVGAGVSLSGRTGTCLGGPTRHGI